MHESEVYIKSIKEHLPAEILNNFNNTLNSIKSRSVLHWAEHCTECAMPACFKTCDLYSPRIDGKCQRFVNGIERIQNEKNKSLNILKIYFKKWGMFATQGNNELYSIKEAEKLERKDLRIASFIHLHWPNYVKKKFVQKRYSIKKNHIIKTQNNSKLIPDAFLVEIYNPSDKIIYINLTVRNEHEKHRKIPFQFRFNLKPGYNKEVISFDEIDKRIKSHLSYRINFTPENIDEDKPLYFGILEFVQFHNYKVSAKKSKKVKCVVWDLDNTIWEGVLMEIGIEKLKLKENIKEILQAIENKGIINSIASKNSFEHAMEALKLFGLDDFFLYPKISWNPKSVAIKEIALDLNISLNTLLFIDDSVFEREEVRASLLQVKVVSASEYQSLMIMDEFQVPVTVESRKRKLLYLHESERKKNSNSYEGEYFDFLLSCVMKLEIFELSNEHFERVYELTQRTNQMNFSGNRYQKKDIQKIAEDADLDTYVLKCYDKFGEYGIIGFAIIMKSENRLIDLMFSCRIQSKRVEHAFITFCLNKYLKYGDFFVTYVPTEKNKFSAQVFDDFQFEQDDQQENKNYLKFPKGKKVLDDKIINVIF